jgi:hypothetical protein
MPIGSILGGLFGAAGSLFGGAQQSSAAKDAAQIQANAQKYAADLQFKEFGDIQNQMRPFLELGTTAANRLGSYYGINANGSVQETPFLDPISQQVGAPPSPNDPSLAGQFRASPGYGYARDQMIDAVQNSAAGKTGAISGNMMKQLQTNAGGMADQDFWNWYNALLQNYGQRYSDIGNQRNTITQVLSGIGGSGQNAAANLGGFGQAAATSIGNAAIGGAQAQAAGRIGSANAMSNMFSNPQLGQGISSGLNYLFGNNGSAGGSGGFAGGGYDPAAYGYGATGATGYSPAIESSLGY